MQKMTDVVLLRGFISLGSIKKLLMRNIEQMSSLIFRSWSAFEPGKLLPCAVSATRDHFHGINVTLCRCNPSPYYCWWWTSHICCCKKKIKSCGVWQDSRDTFAWWYSLWQSYLKRFSTHTMEKMSQLLGVDFLDKVGQDGAQNLRRAYLGTQRLEMTRKW